MYNNALRGLAAFGAGGAAGGHSLPDLALSTGLPLHAAVPQRIGYSGS